MSDQSISCNFPAAVEVERAVLGALLLDQQCQTETIPELSPDYFFDSVNREIFRVILALYDANKPIDLYTVMQACTAVPSLKGLGIAARLTDYTQSVATGAHALEHAFIVKGKYISRRIAIECRRLASLAEDNGNDPADVLDEFQKQADLIASDTLRGGDARTVGDLLRESIYSAETRQREMQNGRPCGITSGILALDRLTGGWRGSQLIVLAARPAMGKTAVMLHFAKAAAMQNVPVCIYSLEMSGVSLSDRLLLSECAVSPDAYRSGHLSQNDWGQIETAGARIAKLPVYVSDQASISMRSIRNHAKMMHRQGKCGIVMIDYLQLVDTSTGNKTRNREQEVAQASREAKIIAKELNVPVLLLAQLSRNVESRSDKRPMLSDLRESGAIEQDADVVSFIYRPAYYGLKEFDAGKYGTLDTEGLGLLMVEKQRDGATGAVLFRHNTSMTCIGEFENKCKEELDNEPF